MNAESGLILDGAFFSVKKFSILQGVYLKLDTGSICGLFGLNGSGKTTVLKLICGQIRATSGITSIDGVRYHKPSLSARFQNMAYLPQDSMVPKELKVESLIRRCGQLSLLEGDDLLGRIRSTRIRHISHGERRYLELSLVLGLERKYVLLDEPFTGVEPRIIERMSERIRERAKAGSGILITDHYHHFVTAIAEYAYLLDQKQCRRLKGDIVEALQRAGYLSVRS